MKKLVLLILILGINSSRAAEPIAGWGNIKFGMSAAEAKAVATAEGREVATECSPDVSPPPYDACALRFHETVAGIDWAIWTYFMPGAGVGKIDLFVSNGEFENAYRSYKDALSNKYGTGTEETLSNVVACQEVQRQKAAGQDTRYVSWIAVTGASYQIAATGGSIQLIYKVLSICSAADESIRTWFEQGNRTRFMLGSRLEITYVRQIAIPSSKF